MTDPLHIHSNRLSRDVNVLLLLIPSIIFILILALLMFSNKDNFQDIATVNEPTVLGKEGVH